MKPTLLNDLINLLHHFPGIGKKQAERFAYFLVTNEGNQVNELIALVTKARGTIKPCSQCNYLSDESLCIICQDKTRQKVLVVVNSALDVFKIEETKTIRPYYFVLGEIVNINKNIVDPEHKLEMLKNYAINFKEVILALSSDLEGIVTANLVKKHLSDKVKITQLAQGIPLGATIDYIDEITLKSALDNRKEFK